jgi:hypothetical protein
VQQQWTISIYHSTESDWDLLKTFHSLQDEWCKEIPTKVQWVKWHADRADRVMTRDERLNIEADLLADKIRAEARSPRPIRIETKLPTLASQEGNTVYPNELHLG